MRHAEHRIIVTGLPCIAEAMGVAVETIRQWAREGAPIAYDIDGEGKAVRYSADIVRLQEWRVLRSRIRNGG